MGYFTQEGLKNLKSYQYKSSPSTTFMSFLNFVLWEPLVRITPSFVAPNLITLVSSLCIAGATAYILMFNKLDLSEQAPRHAPLVAAVGLFLYNTLDNIDGKQARKLRVSSPLGQLMDHGLDSSVNTCALALLIGLCLDMRHSGATMLLLIFMQSCFFYATWEEYHTGVLRIQIANMGVDEAAYFCIASFVGTYFYGYELWETLIWGMELKYWYVALLGLIYLWTLPNFIGTVILHENSVVPVVELIPIGQIYLGMLLFYLSETYEAYTLLILLSSCGILGVVSCSIIICSSGKMSFQYCRVDTSLFLMFGVVAFLGGSSASSMWLWIAFCATELLYMFYFLISAATEISQGLNIGIFATKIKSK